MEDVRNRENTNSNINRENPITWLSKLKFKHAKFIDGAYVLQLRKAATAYGNAVYVGCSISYK